VKERIDQLCDDVKFIKHAITGNGTPERGIIVRLDRLEQSEKARRKWVGAALVAGLGAGVTTVWTKLFGAG
jgi:hypothetical protein